MTTDAAPRPTHIQATPSSRAGGAGWLELALILAIFFVEGGAAPPHVNETHYLAKARHYWDPDFCPGDFFLDSADAHVAFYWTVGWLAKWFTLPTAAWMARLATWTFLAVAWQRLVRATTSAPWAAALSAALWVTLISKANFAGEWVVGGVEGKGFAYGFVLLGFAAVLSGQWRAPWLWFGAASALHVLVGGWAVAIALAVWLTEPRIARAPLTALLPALLAGGAISLIGLAPALALERGVDAATSTEAAQIYVFERLPHHLAPLTLPAEELQRHCFWFGGLGVAFFVLWHWTSAHAASVPDVRAQGEPLLRLFRLAAFALLANVAGLSIEWLLADRPADAARLLRYYWFRQADVVVPMAVAVAAAAALTAAPRPRSWLALAAGAAVVWSAGHLVSLATDRWRRPSPPATRRLDDLASWQDACRWIRDHAPPDAVCLAPRDAQSFKWYAERADVVNWKDVPQDAAGVIEWRRRLRDVYPVVDRGDGPRTLGSPEQWSARRVREVAGRYGARYVLARSSPALPLKRVYPVELNPETDWYAVYDLESDHRNGTEATP